jgi:hypothetical protein
VSYPNTWAVTAVDLTGNEWGLYDDGHSNRYLALRFEGNRTGDIQLGSNSQNAMFFGNSYSSERVIESDAAARPMLLSKDDGFIDFFDENGFLEYYDGVDGAVRKLPKRGRIEARIPATSAGEEEEWALGAFEDPITITRLVVIPDDDITGDDSDTVRLGFRSTDTTGGVDRSLGAEWLYSGTDLSRMVVHEITLDTALADREPDDVLMFEKLETGAGSATPAFALQVEYTGR